MFSGDLRSPALGARESGPSRNGRMERNFPVFRFSRILGQPREIRPKFRNEIPEKDCSIRSPHPEFPEYLVEWKASCHHAKDSGNFGKNSNGRSVSVSSDRNISDPL